MEPFLDGDLGRDFLDEEKLRRSQAKDGAVHDRQAVEAPVLQGRLGIDLNTHPDGKISLIINRGINNGAQIAFAREF